VIAYIISTVRRVAQPGELATFASTFAKGVINAVVTYKNTWAYKEHAKGAWYTGCKFMLK
jgi:uncharacterized protein (DUF697 family)